MSSHKRKLDNLTESSLEKINPSKDTHKTANSTRKIKKKPYLDVETKLKILELHEKGRSVASLAKEFKVGQQTIRDWKHTKSKIEELHKINKSAFIKKKSAKQSDYPQVDHALSLWYLRQKAANKCVTHESLCKQAKIFKASLDLDKKDFDASIGYLTRFCQRHGITPKNSIDSNKSDLKTDSEPPKTKLHRIINEDKYSHKQLFKFDEIGLNWKTFPKKILTDNNIANFSKLEKERITLGICSNSTGDLKIPLLFISKLKHPKCYGLNFNMSSLPVIYKSRTKARINRDIFSSWFNECFVPKVEEYLENSNLEKKALLVLNGSMSHLVDLVSLSGHIKCLALNINNTSLSELTTPSPASCLKRFYRTWMIKELLIKIENQSISDYIKEFKINKCINILATLWTQFPECLLTNYWRKYDINIALNIKPGDLNIETDMYNLGKHLNLTKKDIDDWLELDKNLTSYTIYTDEEIIDIVKNKLKDVNADNDEENFEDESEEEDGDESEDDCLFDEDLNKSVSNTQAINYAEEMLKWLEKQPDSKPEHFLCLESIRMMACSKQSVEQTEYVEYFA